MKKNPYEKYTQAHGVIRFFETKNGNHVFENEMNFFFKFETKKPLS